MNRAEVSQQQKQEGLLVDIKGRRGDCFCQATFSIARGRFCALFGSSGSGKTSLVRAIAGLTRFDGEVRMGAEIWQTREGFVLPTYRRALGYVFQDARLFPFFSVRKNLMYGLQRASRFSPASGLSFDDIVDFLGLEPLLERSAAQLSGGEKQRVALGRALLSRPELLLMDEPLAALDGEAKERLIGLFTGLGQKLNIPVLYISHDAWEVARLADDVLLIDKGEICDRGTPVDIFQRLDHEGFASSGAPFSLLEARVSAHDPKAFLSRLHLGAQYLVCPLSEEPLGRLVSVRVGARDVALSLHKPEGISIRNRLRVKLKKLLFLKGGQVDVHLDLDGQPLRALISQEAAYELNLSEGLELYALIKTVTLERGLAKRASITARG